MKTNKNVILCTLVAIIHIVGFCGFLSKSFFETTRTFVPVYLIAMLLILALSQSGRNMDFWRFLTITYILGFVISLLGVHTSYLFGNYVYGSTLGWKIADVPLITGINWIILIYSAGCFVRALGIRKRLVRATVGAFLIAVLDFLVEPIAIRYDFWSWPGLDIPAQNYVAWFVCSFLLLSIFNAMRFSKKNPVASVLFVSMFLFFLGLNFLIV